MIAKEVLSGEKVRLRPPDERDLPSYVRWFNQPDVRKWLYASERSDETLESQKDRLREQLDDRSWFEWCIETPDGQTVGCTGLCRIDATHGDAELYILIGEPQCWDKGYGTDAIGQALRYGFEELSLRRVELTTDEDNLRAIRCFEKCGFTLEGRQRSKRLRKGEPTGRIIMSVLREEWGAEPAKSAEQPPVIEGETVQLRPLSREDIPLLARRYGDPDVRHWTHLSEDPPEMTTLEAHRERYERMTKEPGRVNVRIETKDGVPVGDAGLMDVHPQARRAELGISLDKEFWSKGYGTEATRLLLRHAFTDLGLRKVYLITDADNARGIRCYEKCGFVREGLLRAHRLRNGQPLDMVSMAILREEFEAQPWK